MINWDENVLNIVKNILNKHTNKDEALEEIKEAIGEEISYNALRKAIKRHCSLSVSDLLAVPRDEDKVESIDHDIDFIVCVMYADIKYHGLDMSAKRIAIELNKHTPYEVYTEESIKAILHRNGQIKKKVPGINLNDVEMIPEVREAIKEKFLQCKELVKLRELNNHTAHDEKVDILKALFDDNKVVPHHLEYKSFVYDKQINPTILTLPVSDIHYGIRQESLKSDFYQKDSSEVSYKILDARASKWRQHASKMISLSNPQVVHYLSLGDDFESLFGNMRPHQLANQDLIEFNLWEKVMSFHLTNILYLLENSSVEQIVVTFTPGNHDRLFGEKLYDSENFVSQLIASFLINHKLLSEYVESGRLNIKSATKIMSYKHSGLPQVNFIAHHGHLFDNKTQKDIVNTVYLHGVTSERHVLIQGHLHHFKAIQASNCLAIWNPSFIGGTEYANIKLQLDSVPQCIGIVSDVENDYVLGPFNL